MRLLGRMDPGSGAGSEGHFASCFLPKATVDANATESCFVRRGRSEGVNVSDPAETAGGTTTGFVAAVSLLLPFGDGTEPGAAS
jgi:hypothetical protein